MKTNGSWTGEADLSIASPTAQMLGVPRYINALANQYYAHEVIITDMHLINYPRVTVVLSLYLRTRAINSGTVRAAASLPPRLVLLEKDLEETFIKGTGPGGQKIVCSSLSR